MTYIGPVGAAQILGAYHRPNWDAVTMVAIAGAESSWRTDAISPTNDYGVWQINSSAWPGLFARYNWWDPVDNAAMMNHVFSIQGYRAWTTYTSGAYQRFWDQANAAVQQALGTGYTGGGTPPGGGGGSAVNIDIAAGVNQVSGQVESLANDQLRWSDAIRHMW